MSAPALSPPESCDTASMPRPDSPTATWNPDAGAGSRGDPLLPPGRLFADRYEVRELLGTGGSAQVFRAWDRTLRREVALKVLRPETAGANARFLSSNVLICSMTVDHVGFFPPGDLLRGAACEPIYSRSATALLCSVS